MQCRVCGLVLDPAGPGKTVCPACQAQGYLETPAGVIRRDPAERPAAPVPARAPRKARKAKKGRGR